MSGRQRRIILAAAGLVLGLDSLAASRPGLVLVRDGRSEDKSVIGRDAPPNDTRAATELRRYLRSISGADVPIVGDDGPASSREILVGRGARRELGLGEIEGKILGPDGFVIKTRGSRLIISGGPDKGTLYGVAAFLEDYGGVRKYSREATVIPRRRSIVIPFLDRVEIPSFDYREILMPEVFDDDYADWHKLDNRKARERDWGLFVHTFDDFVPPGKYFAAHSEYFSLAGGQRIPFGQLCLSNPDVLRLVVAGLRERIAENPGAKFWSVSQNDTFYPCQCPDCLALDQKFGGPSGTLLNFVNRVAAEFPDKTISTLAYQYSRPAPTGIRPAANVNIMLCTIECNRSRPIAADAADASFVKDIRNWTNLTRNIFLWDYVVQFRNLCSPFPNLRVLKPNVKFFAANGIRMVFEQGSSNLRSEFHELRTYLLAKLLWNPEADVESLTNDFVAGYYGPAAKYIRRYLRTTHDALERSGGDLGIYGFPWDGIKSYLTPALLDRYSALFDRAEAAAAGRPEFLKRVQSARLPLEFAILEISRRNPTPKYSVFLAGRGAPVPNPDMRSRLEAFIAGAERAGIERLNEHGTPPGVYKAEMERFFASGMLAHRGWKKPVRVLTVWSEKYPVGGGPALTDGLKGTADYHCNWLGFEGNDLEAVVDLEKPADVSSISLDFLQSVNSWIWVPDIVEFFVSTDGVRFDAAGEAKRTTDEKAEGDLIENFSAALSGQSARYIKIATKSRLACPSWHKGAGGKSWLFCDEIVIR